jgi:hypothetical protein
LFINAIAFMADAGAGEKLKVFISDSRVELAFADELVIAEDVCSSVTRFRYSTRAGGSPGSITNGVTVTHAKLASGWLACLYREGVEPSGSR